jgi:beta-aspartyl-peptidase (threonine type)
MNPSISRLRIGVALLLVVVAVVLTIHMRKGGENSEEAIRKVLDDQVGAWNRGDLEGFMQGYWKSDELTFFSDGNNGEQGWQGTYDRYKRRYQSDGKEMGTVKFDELRLDMEGTKSALVRGHWQLTFKDGKTKGGLFTLLFREEPQGWCIVHDHTSVAAEVPLPAPGGDR